MDDPHHRPHRLRRRTSRTRLDYAEAVLIIRRTMAHPNGHPIEVTEVKAPANRYEIGYHRELADDPEADFTPQELSDNGIDRADSASKGDWGRQADPTSPEVHTMDSVPAWAVRLRAERRGRLWTQRDMAKRLADAADPHIRARLPEWESLIRMIKDWEAGRHQPKDPYRLLYCQVFGMEEAELFADDAEATVRDNARFEGEIEALELARRVAASDVGNETLDRLESAVDDLAMAYQRTPPAELLKRARQHLSYVSHLINAKKTIIEHRRLLTTGGWLSLLASTCYIDLREFDAAATWLQTFTQLAKHAECPEIAAWCLETEAWQAVTTGDYRRALTLTQGAQVIAPRGSSACIQATAQEGRVWARLGSGPETRDALNRVARLVSPLSTPEHPEHHYRYDPSKSDAYVATTLSWLGDPAAEPHARQVLARMESAADGPFRPRRAASARLDLALALLAADQPDEAGRLTLRTMTSGVLVPSSY